MTNLVDGAFKVAAPGVRFWLSIFYPRILLGVLFVFAGVEIWSRNGLSFYVAIFLVILLIVCLFKAVSIAAILIDSLIGEIVVSQRKQDDMTIIQIRSPIRNQEFSFEHKTVREVSVRSMVGEPFPVVVVSRLNGSEDVIVLNRPRTELLPFVNWFKNASMPCSTQ
ncbi:MAG: hypothetical protein ACK56W_23335 [Pirellula sp.]|jgi:hypothetical protein